MRIYIPSTIMMFPSIQPINPEPPLTYLMAGYIISGITARRLTLTLNGVNPDNLPNDPRYAKSFPLPPRAHHFIGDNELMKKSIAKYMAEQGLKPEKVGVEIELTEVDGDLKTIIATQSCILPHEAKARPEAKIGNREGLIRRWLEHNGMLFLASHLTYSHITTGITKEYYKWGFHERPYGYY